MFKRNTVEKLDCHLDRIGVELKRSCMQVVKNPQCRQENLLDYGRHRGGLSFEL